MNLVRHRIPQGEMIEQQINMGGVVIVFQIGNQMTTKDGDVIVDVGYRFLRLDPGSEPGPDEGEDRGDR